MKCTIDLSRIHYHRNGMAGLPFHVVPFKADDGYGDQPMVAIVFQKEGAIAILNTAETAYGNFSFHEGPENNKWRGDRFEAEIRRAIVLAETAEKIKY